MEVQEVFPPVFPIVYVGAGVLPTMERLLNFALSHYDQAKPQKLPYVGVQVLQKYTNGCRWARCEKMDVNVQ